MLYDSEAIMLYSILGMTFNHGLQEQLEEEAGSGSQITNFVLEYLGHQRRW